MLTSIEYRLDDLEHPYIQRSYETVSGKRMEFGEFLYPPGLSPRVSEIIAYRYEYQNETKLLQLHITHRNQETYQDWSDFVGDTTTDTISYGDLWLEAFPGSGHLIRKGIASWLTEGERRGELPYRVLQIHGNVDGLPVDTVEAKAIEFPPEGTRFFHIVKGHDPLLDY